MTSDPEHPTDTSDAVPSDNATSATKQAEPSSPRDGFPGPIPAAVKAMSTKEIKAALRQPHLISDPADRRAIFEEFTVRLLDNPCDPEFVANDPARFLRAIVASIEAGVTKNPVQEEIDRHSIDQARGSLAPERPRRKRPKRAPGPTQ